MFQSSCLLLLFIFWIQCLLPASHLWHLKLFCFYFFFFFDNQIIIHFNQVHCQVIFSSVVREQGWKIRRLISLLQGQFCQVLLPHQFARHDSCLFGFPDNETGHRSPSTQCMWIDALIICWAEFSIILEFREGKTGVQRGNVITPKVREPVRGTPSTRIQVSRFPGYRKPGAFESRWRHMRNNIYWACTMCQALCWVFYYYNYHHCQCQLLLVDYLLLARLYAKYPLALGLTLMAPTGQVLFSSLQMGNQPRIAN